MRILQAIHDFLPEHCAGSEIYTYHLSRALAARGHDVRLLFTEKRLERPQFEITAGSYEDLPFHEIVYNRHFHDIQDLYDDARMEQPIGAVLDQVKPDVVHVQSLVYLGLSLIRAARSRGLPLVMTLHEYFLSCPRGGLLLDLEGNLCDPIRPEICARCIQPYPMERERYPDSPDDPYQELGELRFWARAIDERTRRIYAGVAEVDRFVAPSSFLAERLVREGLERSRVTVADYGFPAPEAPPRVVPRPGEPLRLGYLGTLSDYKGVDVLVDAFSRLEPGLATLRICGDPGWFPEYTGPLMKRAGEIAGLSFVGRLEPTEAPAFLATLDALVVPSIWYENSPLTIHEAFLAGVPVVTSDLGGMAELVASGGGLVFRRGDPADLHRCLCRLLDEPRLLARLGAGIPAVKSVEANAEEMESLYRSLA